MADIGTVLGLMPRWVWSSARTIVIISFILHEGAAAS
jgi:hypothetical protein